MAKYLDIDKIIFPNKRDNNERFLFTFKNKKNELTAVLHSKDVESIYTEIGKNLGINSNVGFSEREIDEIVKFQNCNKNLCFSCKHRMRECYRCVNVCESPIERDLFLGLRNVGLDPLLQVWISKRNGQMYPREANFSLSDCLTRPDFYFENANGKFCIYADGFTYHNKSEEKVGKDRNIDNKLQNFGYRVLRFTGKRIREELNSVISEIRSAVEV